MQTKYHEPTTHFVYPDEENYTSEDDRTRFRQEFVSRMLFTLYKSNSMAVTLTAYCFAVGIDLKPTLGTNTEAGVARLLGISKQRLNRVIKSVCKEHNIQYHPSQHKK
jgi:hypothetical protein